MSELNLAPLTDSEFNELVRIIYDKTRIQMSEHKRALVTSRISKRIRALNMSSFKEYIDYLKGAPDEEVTNFINAVTTNKTDFFRENKHFEYMKTTFLPNWEKSYKEGKVNNLRIWSAACSTGEEPYTIAMTLHDYFGERFNHYDIKILASDIDTNVLSHACAGIYKEETVETIQTNTLKKYFLKGTGNNAGLYKVKNILQKCISFRQLNFKDEDFDIHTKFDLIFCRNVIIYFDKEFQKELFNKFYRYMKEDSYVFIGHSETLFGISDLFKYISSNIYKKI
ncbi:protein-glutamate O-methyltransferase [Brachyspira pilosicoli]|uniref:protein-glutamate O-methyltransferase n=4 Tax=Brachyspira pilosicoli TaxID=52584 RepID=D8IBE2_BRAP9|nr:protein-glutamate O-methyltransferase [Brachyspira pilosicoli]ADK30465.1 chemotaxis protein methyltransferase, CheR [Brachyspira pilosicoli 95/1000]AFR70272.1 chemotaxis protein methyltransferase CheR [Brachyspira pilosicoli B2904]AGA65502.1 chemotaxis protein methyltransferase CheR [Brachyspira pilosicoli P43/6/78]MBW5377368.1 chemotaxis protein CheR [Brachyspira pilosicoli]MBW5383323.1 chemotaxis protein CheR [Brachyspira pilosicoli]